MDLYGSGASISQANSQTQEARQMNQAAAEFNNSLAEQLDQSNLEQDEDRSSKLQKNLLSSTTAAGKLAVLRKEGTKGLKVGRFKEMPITKEELLAREVGAERAPLTNPPAEGGAVAQRPVGTTEVYTGEAKLAEQEAAKASEVAGSTGVKASAEAIEGYAKTVGKVGRVGVAGLGGAFDVVSDIDRFASGAKPLDVFGSNSASRIGNITNIVGSGLEMLGAATGGITPWALALEGTGALLSLGGGLVEGVGEEEAADDSKKTAAQDISSQQRGMVAADTVEQAVGRTQ
jgi:hypothetical protein